MNETLNILIILTSHASLGDTGHSTGVWLEEFTTPYYVFAEAGAKIDVASIQGGLVPIDPNSLKPLGENPASVDSYLGDDSARTKVANSIKIDAVFADSYDAIFLPGGHGTMWDLPASAELSELLSTAWANEKILAAVCHGPAGLVNVVDSDRKPLVSGRKVTGFTNSEEEAAGLTDAVPFLLESKLRELGADYQFGPDFEAFSVRDGNLVTGQNPASSEQTAQLVLEALKQ